MIRRLAKELLALHLERDEDRFEAIVGTLTTTFYSHLHAISRDEAQELLGDWIKTPNEAEGAALTALFDQYMTDLKLRERFNLPSEMADQPTISVHVLGGILENRESSHVYTTDISFGQRPNLPPGVQVQVPPGQALPMTQFVGRTYEWGIQRMGWQRNGAND